MNQLLRTAPFDLYELTLFQLVVKHSSFTRAAKEARLTQSAMTRQILGMESILGIKLLERTTRTVRVTEAGKFLYGEAVRLLGDVDQSLSRLAQDFGNAPKEVRVGISRSIGLSYLPGFFRANQKKFPHVGYRIAGQSNEEIISALEANELDVGMICPPSRLAKTLRITHQFDDGFALIASAQFGTELEKLNHSKARSELLKKQNWLLIDEKSNTGQQLRVWMNHKGWRIKPAMQLDNFDMIINLIALGMGISFVPIRALALYNQKQNLFRVPLQDRFSRKIVVVTRKQRQPPAHVTSFIDNILF